MTDTAETPSNAAATPTPGLSRLEVAVDTQPGFLDAMLDAITSHRQLAGLSTRETDDTIIGLFDAAATMLDVLAFYGEEITNENYIRTAGERRSVVELAELIGYEPAPGVAASTLLALDVEPPPGVAEEVHIPAGLPVQKLPGDDGLVAVYESAEELSAWQDLNSLRPVIVEDYQPRLGDETVVLDGIGLGLSPGDIVVVVGDERLVDPTSERWDVRTVTAVEEIPNDNGLDSDLVPARTVITIDRALGHIAPDVAPAATAARCFVMAQTGTLFGAGAVAWHDLPVALRIGEDNPDPTKSNFITGPYANDENNWVDANLAAGTDELWLDRIHKNVAADSWVVVSKPGYQELYRVTDAEHGNHSAFMMSGPSTRIGLDGTENIELFSIRTSAVFSGSREIALGSVPMTEPLSGNFVTVHGAVVIPDGRLVLISGLDATSGEAVAEQLVVDHTIVDHLNDTTSITFTTSTRYSYEPAGCRIRGNVVAANHGQSVRSQPIGSGDAGVPFATITLPTTADNPLTYVAAATPSGRESTLHVRVDGVLWTEVDSLAEQESDAQVYVVRHLDDGAVEIQFGDGRTGARPASGRDNITAEWRTGIGAAGTALAGQITVPLGMPLGLKSVVNPVAATGAEDPETLDTARVNAPTTIKALGRIVSLPDVEDFARTFAGIGWANAQALDDGDQPVVVLSVALADGSPLEPDSDTEEALVEAVEQVRIGDRRILVKGHVDRSVDVDLLVEVDPLYVTDEVMESVAAAVDELFDHTPRLGEGRGFGRLLTPTLVLGAVHDLPGVVGAKLRKLRPTVGLSPAVTEVLARPARVEAGSVVAAEMLTTGTITLTPGTL